MGGELGSRCHRHGGVAAATVAVAAVAAAVAVAALQPTRKGATMAPEAPSMWMTTCQLLTALTLLQVEQGRHAKCVKCSNARRGQFAFKCSSARRGQAAARPSVATSVGAAVVFHATLARCLLAALPPPSTQTATLASQLEQIRGKAKAGELTLPPQWKAAQEHFPDHNLQSFFSFFIFLSVVLSFFLSSPT